MKLPFPFIPGRKRRGSTAVMAFDGAAWRRVVPTPNGKGWKTDTVGERGSAMAAPLESLKSVATAGARGVRVMLPSDIHNMELEIPADLDWRQASTAVMWEVAALTGRNSGEMVNASTKLSALGVEQGGGSVLTASFDAELLKRFGAQCADAGLEFDGLVSLQFALLAVHLANKNTARKALLLLSRDSVFAFLPPGGVPSHRPAIRNIATTLPEHGEDDDLEKIERRITRRLALGGRDATLYLADAAPKRVEEILEHGIGAGEIEKKSVEELWSDLAETAANAEADRFDTPCPLAAPPGKRMGKEMIADALVVALLAAAVALPALLAGILVFENKAMAKRVTAAKSFDERQTTLERGQARLESEIKTLRLVSGGGKVDKVFVDALRLLAATVPKGVALDSLRYDSGTFKIAGTANSQKTLSAFHERVGARAKSLGLRVSDSSLSKSGGGKTLFEIELSGTGKVEAGK